jgi:TolA-binding protein
MSTQLDVLAARLARSEPSPAPAPAARAMAGKDSAVAASPGGEGSHAARTSTVAERAPAVPANLKVVKLEPPKGAASPRSGKTSAAPPSVPTSTPIQEPTAAALASLAKGGKAGDAQGAYDRARAQTGLARARAMEQFADDHPSSVHAGEALVDAARARRGAGDPDGACEDFTRAVAEHPASRAMPDALEGLAACEQRRGRPAEASRLHARLIQDYPDSPAGRRAAEHAPVVQGAAP